jgi:hypothetical protein
MHEGRVDAQKMGEGEIQVIFGVLGLPYIVNDVGYLAITWLVAVEYGRRWTSVRYYS